MTPQCRSVSVWARRVVNTSPGRAGVSPQDAMTPWLETKLSHRATLISSVELECPVSDFAAVRLQGYGNSWNTFSKPDSTSIGGQAIPPTLKT